MICIKRGGRARTAATSRPLVLDGFARRRVRAHHRKCIGNRGCLRSNDRQLRRGAGCRLSDRRRGCLRSDRRQGRVEDHALGPFSVRVNAYGRPLHGRPLGDGALGTQNSAPKRSASNAAPIFQKYASNGISVAPCPPQWAQLATTLRHPWICCESRLDSNQAREEISSTAWVIVRPCHGARVSPDGATGTSGSRHVSAEGVQRCVMRGNAGFCGAPSGRRPDGSLHRRKPLISQSPSTVHGVVFAVFVLGGASPPQARRRRCTSRGSRHRPAPACR